MKNNYSISTDEYNRKETKEKNLDKFLDDSDYDENRYITNKRYKVLADRSLARSMLFPLYGQLYNWRVLGIENYKKTLFFSIALSVALGFFLYNHGKFIDSNNSSNQQLYYRHRTYALSLLSIIYFVCVFDSYASVHKYRSDFTSNLSVVNKSLY